MCSWITTWWPMAASRSRDGQERAGDDGVPAAAQEDVPPRPRRVLERRRIRGCVVRATNGEPGRGLADGERHLLAEDDPGSHLRRRGQPDDGQARGTARR